MESREDILSEQARGLRFLIGILAFALGGVVGAVALLMLLP